MKKIYVMFFLSAVTFCSNAQVTLTKAFNEPVVGDLYVKASYDSVTAVPKNTGTGQLWNFSAFTANSFTETSTFTTVASAPNAATFPAATVAENQGGTNYTMYKSNGSNWEVQGINSTGGGAVVNFTNTGIFAVWPISMGYSNTDVAGGTGTSGSVTTVINATINTNASGTGTVMLPGGGAINNVLQVVQSLTVSQTTGTMVGGFVQKTYDYYSSTQKFPVVSIQYQSNGGFNIFVNKNVIAGLSHNEFLSEFSVYPNPAKDILNLSISSEATVISAIITNLLGQEVKSVSFGNAASLNRTINVADLAKGIYLLNVKTDKGTLTKKIVIE